MGIITDYVRHIFPENIKNDVKIKIASISEK